MKDDMQFEHLDRIIADLRKDVETLQKLRRDDTARVERWKEEAAFGRKCRIYVGAMAEVRRSGMPAWLEMCNPILVEMLNRVAPPEDLSSKEVNP